MSIKAENRNILLIGNPNVGKSAIFSRMTGARVTISNYPGTTVGFTQGNLKTGEDTFATLIDVPGIYSLTPHCRADEVAVTMMEKGDLLVNVVDATNLERNLFLTLELRELGVPMVIALNMWDETHHKGIDLDIERLEKELGIPVVPTCGLTGAGIKGLVEKLAAPGRWKGEPLTKDLKWEEIGRILENTQVLHHRHHTLLERFEDLSIHPATGLPIAASVVYLSFLVVRFLGEGLITFLFEPLFDKLWLPVVTKISGLLHGAGLVHDILIGHLVGGAVDFQESFGLLTTGLYVPIAAVLPYILSFYLVLGVLEDFGYLPRLATQVDNLMHRFGLHGYAIVPIILGLGCNVPGAMALRLMEGRREKFIAATLMAIAVPCMAQIAMIVGLVGERGGGYVSLIFFILAALLVIKGLILNRFIPGKSPEILWEIPPYRIPHIPALAKKLGMRVAGFLTEAVPYVLLGVFIVNILYILRVFDVVAGIFAPVLSGLWGLPEDTISALLVGFLRKDVAVGMLGPLALSNKQLVIACTILAIYFPCMATFMVMVRELGIRDMVKSAAIMIATALTVGTVLNLIL